MTIWEVAPVALLLGFLLGLWFASRYLLVSRERYDRAFLERDRGR